MKLNRFFTAVLFICSVSFNVHALSIKDVVKEAAEYKTVEESINYLEKTISKLTSNADRRSGYAFLGSVQEQLGKYNEAQNSYIKAAAIDAGDAAGMPKKSSEQLVIDAVRCALSVGDYSTANRHLDSDVKKSKNEKIIAYRNLYIQWSSLCKADNISETNEAVSVLKSYLTSDSMKLVRPQILLTLNHITGDESYAKKLTSEYPNSMEAGIVKGNVEVLPTPFWYFVPRKEFSSEFLNSSNPKKAEVKKVEISSASKNEKNATKSSGTVVKQQLGLFRDEVNARHLVEKLESKGFKAQISTEVRPSGTTYYLVYVRENKEKNMAEKLRSAGYDCYPLFE